MITGYASVLGTPCTLSSRLKKTKEEKKKQQEIIFDFPDRIAFLIITRSSFNCDRIKNEAHIYRARNFLYTRLYHWLKFDGNGRKRAIFRCSIVSPLESVRSKKKKFFFQLNLGKGSIGLEVWHIFTPHGARNVSFNWKRLLMVVNINTVWADSEWKRV